MIIGCGCLYAIESLAKNALRRQGEGEHAVLAPQSAQAQALMAFLQSLFSRLLFEDFEQSQFDPACDLTLVLILCFEAPFQAMVEQLLEGRPAAERPRLQQEFGALLVGVSKTLERANRTRFRTNMQQLLVSARGMMNVR